MSTVAFNIRSLAWNVCNLCVAVIVFLPARVYDTINLTFVLFRSYFESKSVVLELRRAEDVSGFGDDLWNAIGGLGRGLEQKTGRVRPLLDKAKRMTTAFSSALRSSFQDMIATFRGGLLVSEASLCLRVLSCPAVLLNGERSWLPYLPDLCLSILDVCPGPVFDALADCMMTLGADVFGPAAGRSQALARVCKAAADSACNDDLDTGAAASKLLCRYFLAFAEQSSPFPDNSSAVRAQQLPSLCFCNSLNMYSTLPTLFVRISLTVQLPLRILMLSVITCTPHHPHSMSSMRYIASCFFL
jgi:hypothetical protein